MSENWGLSDRAKQIYKSGNMRQKKIDRYKKNRDSPKIKNGNRSVLGFGTLGPVPIGTEAEAEALGKALFIVVGIRFKFIEAYLIRIEFVGKHIIRGHHTDAETVIDHPVHFDEGFEIDAIIFFLNRLIIEAGHAGILYPVIPDVEPGCNECFFRTEMVVAQRNTSIENSLHGGHGIVDLIGRHLELFVATVQSSHESFCSEVNTGPHIENAGETFFESAIGRGLRHHEIEAYAAMGFIVILRGAE